MKITKSQFRQYVASRLLMLLEENVSARYDAQTSTSAQRKRHPEVPARLQPLVDAFSKAVGRPARLLGTSDNRWRIDGSDGYEPVGVTVTAHEGERPPAPHNPYDAALLQCNAWASALRRRQSVGSEAEKILRTTPAGKRALEELVRIYDELSERK